MDLIQKTISECTEQWTSLNLQKDNWLNIGDVKLQDEVIKFYRDPNAIQVGDVGGAIWYKASTNNMNGVKFNFRPVVEMDLNYYGNVKFPQGFALILTSSPISSSLIGDKRSGLGYHGINQAIAIEFDFVQNNDKNDIKEPHLSVHHNIDGPISSRSPDTKCDGLCNIRLPNFYDNQKEIFDNSLTFSVEIFNGKIWVYYNDMLLINGKKFLEFDKLMENKEVHFGFTASMNLYKSVAIHDFNIFKIIKNDVVKLSERQKLQAISAGSDITLIAQLTSICGKPLKLYPEDIKKIMLTVNNKDWKDKISKEFIPETYSLTINVRDIKKAGLTSFSVAWVEKDKDAKQGESVVILVKPNDINKFDICKQEVDYKDYLVDIGTSDKKYYVFNICSYDQFKNRKTFYYNTEDDLVMIEYPDGVPSEAQLKITPNFDNTRFTVSVPLTTIGIYTIFNDHFFGSRKKFFKVVIGAVDPNESYGEIFNYFEKTKSKINNPVSLIIRLKDSLGDEFSLKDYEALKCNMYDSFIILTGKDKNEKISLKNNFIEKDNEPCLEYTPTTTGKYEFVPLIKCGSENLAIRIQCDLCTFYIPTSIVDTTKFLFFSDYKKMDIFNTDLNADYLFISLEENNNKKVTTMKFVDTSSYVINIADLDAKLQTAIKDIKAVITRQGSEDINLITVLNPAGGAEFYLPDGADRKSLFSPVKTYDLLVTLNLNDLKINQKISLKFVYKDEYMNNISNSKIDKIENFLAFYFPSQTTLKASNSILLFKIVSRDEEKQLTSGDNLNTDKLQLTLKKFNGQDSTINLEPKVWKQDMFLYVSASMTKSGIYTIAVAYNNVLLDQIDVTITSVGEVVDIKIDETFKKIKSFDKTTNTITFVDLTVDENLYFSFDLVDEYGNIVEEDYNVIKNSITINAKNNDEFNLSTIENGRATLINKERLIGQTSYSIRLNSGKIYTFVYNNTSSKVDPTISKSDLLLQKPTLVAGSKIEAILNLRDSYVNDVTNTIVGNESLFADFKKDLSIYLLGPNNSVINMKFDQANPNSILYSVDSVTVAGEYSFMTFYKNVLLECSTCYVTVIPSELNFSKVDAFYVTNSGYRKLSTTNYQLIDPSNDFVVNFVFYDKYGNEVSYTDKSYELFLNNESNDIAEVSMCKIILNDKINNRIYYNVCGNSRSIFSESQGKFNIAIDTFKFKLNLQRNFYESEPSTPSKKNSYLVNAESVIIGTVDNPAKINIDLRSENDLRYNNILDISRLSVKSTEELETKFFFGPNEGLITLLVFSKKPIATKVSVLFDQTAILENISIDIKAGQVASIKEYGKSVSYSQSNFVFLELNDAFGNPTGITKLESNQVLADYIVTLKDSYLNTIVRNYNYYNPTNGILTVSLQNTLIGDMILESPFITTPIVIKTNNKKTHLASSFAEFENNSDLKIGESSKLILNLVDKYYNSIDAKLEAPFLYQYTAIVLLLEGNKTKYYKTIKATSDDNNIFFNIDFDKSGNYIVKPLFANNPLKCNQCTKKVISGSVKLSHTKLKLKLNDSWLDKTQSSFVQLNKQIYPVFSVKFADSSNSITNTYNDKDFTYELSSESDTYTFPLNNIVTNKYGIILTLNAEGEQKYRSIRSIINLKLTITNKQSADKIIFKNIIVLQSENQSTITDNCQTDPTPTWYNTSDNTLRAGSEVMAEFQLICNGKLMNVDISDFMVNLSNLKASYDIIRSDRIGRYLLIVRDSLKSDNSDVELYYKKSGESTSFKYNIISSLNLSSINFTPGAGVFVNSINGDFYAEVLDEFKNTVTGDDTSIFYENLPITITSSSGKRLPYRISFDTIQNKFFIQYPILSSDKLVVSSNFSTSKLNIDIKPSDELDSTLFEITKTENKMTAKVILRDVKYKVFTDDSIKLNQFFSVEYYTFNFVENTKFSTNLNMVLRDGYVEFDLTGLPSYHIVVFRPLNQFYDTACKGCMIRNNNFNSLYEYRSEFGNDFIAKKDLIYLSASRHVPFFLFEKQGSVNTVTLLNDNNTINLDFFVRIVNEVSQVYIGFNKLESKKSDIKHGDYKLKIDETIFQVFYDKNLKISNEKAVNLRVSTKSVVSGQSRKFNYILVEGRDESNVITKNRPYFVIPSKTLYNIIPTSHPGSYLIELTHTQIPDYHSFNLIQNKYPIILDISPGFPLTLEIANGYAMDWNSMTYQIFSKDRDNNFVCDYRLNIKLESLAGVPLNFDLVKTDTICEIYVNFNNKAKFSSILLGNKETTLDNNKDSTVSLFKSYMVIDNSWINDFNKNVSITVNLKTLFSGYLDTNSHKKGSKIRIYSILEFDNRLLVNEFIITDFNLTFNPSDYKMNYGNYIIVCVVNDLEVRRTSIFRIFKSPEQVPNDLVITMNTSKGSEKLSNIYPIDSTNMETRTTLNGLFSLSLNVINKANEEISFPKDFSIKAEFIKPDLNKSLFNLGSLGVNNYEYNLSLPLNNIDYFLHLPKGDYNIKFTAVYKENKIERILPVSIPEGLFHLSKRTYALPDEPLGNAIEFSINKDNVININANTFSRTNVCLSINGKIYNNYINPSKLKFDNVDRTNCSIYLSIYYRGCAELFIQCKSIPAASYKPTIIYDNIKINTLVIINVDPQLPPNKFTLIKALPKNVDNNSKVNVQFNLEDKNGNKFKYISKENFDVYINNKSQDNHSVWFDQINNIINMQFELSYPPREKKIQILFKDSANNYMLLNELSSNVSVKQGDIISSKTKLVIPVSYKAGEALKILGVFRDSYNNCYEDNIDLSLVRLELIDSNQSIYKDFSLTQTITNYLKCKSIVEANTDKLTFTTAGIYQVNMYYKDSIVGKEKLIISANDMTNENTEFAVSDQGVVDFIDVGVGQTINIEMTGKDQYGNEASYSNLSDKMKIQIDDAEENTDYIYSVSSKNDKIVFTFTPYKLGELGINYLISDTPFIVKNGLTKIFVFAGECSDIYPVVEYSKDSLYSGEYAIAKIECRDKFNNPISSRGEESFTAEVKGLGLEIVNEDKIPHTLDFYDGAYVVQFLVAFNGKYELNIYLNGRQYNPNPITFNVKSQRCSDDQPYMCSNKMCVDQIIKCKNDVKSDQCIDPEKPYYCSLKGEKTCVARYSECDCPKGFVKCKGTCIPEERRNYCTDKLTSNCQRKLPNFAEPIACDDGSCRTSSDCANPIACPIGFKPCGAECIKRVEKCLPEKFSKCNSNEVTCWDLSCAPDIDSCPTGKTCNKPTQVVCPDGKCVDNESMCSQPPSCVEPFNYLCPDHTCKMSEKDCMKKPVCFVGQALCENNKCSYDCKLEVNTCKSNEILCPTGQCASNYLLCPTSVTCPEHTIKCPSGGCVKTFEECKFSQGVNFLTCPLEAPILCPDLSCVKDSNFCVLSPSCPQNLPYKCWNNECRENLEECPTRVTCPSDFPVLCYDGSCKRASYHCPLPLERSYYEQDNKVRCSDGSYVHSLNLCPTQVTCPKNSIKCWNGSCESNIEDCEKPKIIDCPENFPHRCTDGSCRNHKRSCSTISICPLDRPVKCYDNTCRRSFNLCPAFDKCHSGMKSCPDGTCTKDKCSTMVTCTDDNPFLCQDNTCKNSVRDCPPVDRCNGFQCPDGSCVKNRELCKPLDSCSGSNPTKCSSGQCLRSVIECSSRTASDCPLGFVRCMNGECKINESLCTKFSCPANLPFRCPEGVCVSSQIYCDKPNGCPYNKTIKCESGRCVTDMSKCSMEDSDKCEKGLVRCPDGSCRKNSEDCPNFNGCSKNKYLKCADGICILPSATNICNPPICPFTTPIKCLNGMCVDSHSKCTKVPRPQDYSDCQDEGFPGHYMCADGRCVESAGLCRPLFKCPNEQVLCPDGTCKATSELCPKNSNCPKARPIRTNTGRCISNENEIYSLTICPPDSPKKCETGACIGENMSCSTLGHRLTGCHDDTPYKCIDGRCMKDELECQTVNIACKIDSPILCPDGQCYKTRDECIDKKDKCPDKYVRCPDNKCVPESEYQSSCLNRFGCPLVTPFRCSNGTCQSDPNMCATTLSCPINSPILCDDKSCAATTSECNVVYQCLEKEHKCENTGFCIANKDDCKKLDDLCPASIPVKCPTGRCVSHIKECTNEFYLEKCKQEEFLCAAKQQCVKSIQECVGSKNASGAKEGSQTRLLEQMGENGCSLETPFSCYDGSCRKKAEECPIKPACGVLHYRCGNGLCVTDPSKCELNDVICAKGLNKCEDGLCRNICPRYNGCPNELPYQCSNAKCVKNKLACIGYSLCQDIKTPFRCMDGTCVSDPKSCNTIYRLLSPISHSLTIDTNTELKTDFVFDSYNTPVGSLYIPSNSLKSTSQYFRLNITEVSHSSLRRDLYNNTEINYFFVANGIPGSEGILDFDNSVLSPIVSITSEDPNTEFNRDGVINLNHNTYSSQKVFKTSDYCLALLNDAKFECQVRKETEDQTSFKINKFGIYAVIINPINSYVYPKDNISQVFDYVYILAYIFISLIVVAVVVYYIFSRAIRYKEKYIENKKKIFNLQNQFEEYKNMTIDMPGQTLVDNIAGIQFTKNPAFSVIINKNSLNEMESEVENIHRKCRLLETQNSSLDIKISEAQEMYRTMRSEIEKIKNQ